MIGFVGLGTMGLPMAGHLVRAGHDVMVWNRTPGREVKGATLAESPDEVGKACNVVMICVNRSEDVSEVISRLRPAAGATIVDHSTIAPDAARAIYLDLQQKNVGFVDAPITGGSMGAMNGTLTIFCGGDDAEIERVKPILAAYGRRVERVGVSGQGQMMKLANQVAVGGALLALCECLAFAKKAGLDLSQAQELIGSGAAASWAFDHYGPKILSADWSPGFSVKNQRKDFAYARVAAREVGAAIPGTDLVDKLLETLQNEGRGEDTTAALFEVMCRINS